MCFYNIFLQINLITATDISFIINKNKYNNINKFHDVSSTALLN